MPNEMTISLFHSEWGIQNDDYLQHYGVFGMHWGIRRYQPYGEGGYDPDHEGKNIGLAARLAGHTGSYSDAIKRGSSFGNRAKAAASNFGKRAGKAASEAVERFNYASDRTAQGILNAGRKARSAADSAKRAIGEAAIDAKFFATRYTSEERRAVTDFYKNKVQDSLRGAVGKVKTGSKEFARNAAMTAALFGGALDPRNEGFTKIQARADVASGLSGKSSSLYSGWYEHESRMNPGQKLSELSGGRVQGLHSDALDLAGRLASSKYGGLSKSGSRMLQNPALTRSTINLQKGSPDRSNLGTYSPSAAIRLAGSGTSPINQKSTAPRWKGNDGMNTEARKRFATGELAELDSRFGVRPRGSIATGLATKPYKDYDKVSPAAWKERQEEHMDYRDRVKPSRFTRDKLASKIGNMTTEKFNKELEKRGISFAMINQTPVPMIPKGQNNASIRELEKRLGII